MHNSIVVPLQYKVLYHTLNNVAHAFRAIFVIE